MTTSRAKRSVNRQTLTSITAQTLLLVDKAEATAQPIEKIRKIPTGKILQFQRFPNTLPTGGEGVEAADMV